jgi:hypothetical protein
MIFLANIIYESNKIKTFYNFKWREYILKYVMLRKNN